MSRIQTLQSVLVSILNNFFKKMDNETKNDKIPNLERKNDTLIKKIDIFFEYREHWKLGES